MKKATIFIACLLCYSSAFAFDWKAKDITITSAPEAKVLSLKSPQGYPFNLKNPEKATEKSVTKILQMVELFFQWQHIKIAKLDFIIDNKSLRAIVHPSTIHYKKLELHNKIPSGMMFIGKQLKDDSESKSIEVLQFNFRVVDKRFFLRIKGNYIDEQSMLDNIVSSLKNSEQRVKEDNPKYLQLKSKQFETDIKQIKETTQSLLAEIIKLKKESDDLRSKLSALNDESRRLKQREKTLTEQARVSKAEAANLRQTIIALNESRFCFDSSCKTRLPDDAIFSTTRHAPETVKNVEEQLQKLGYPITNVDENWGYHTFNALVQFQQSTPLVDVTGELDNISQILLNHPNLLKIDIKQRPFNFDVDITQAESQLFILKAQMRLLNRRYTLANLHGIWDINTLRTLMLFQSDNALPITGQFDSETIKALFHSNPEEVLSEIRQPEKFSNELISNLNATLYLKGFAKQIKNSEWNIDSIIDLANFQKDNKLYISGELNFETLYALFDCYNGYLNEIPSYVEKVQVALYNQGYQFGEIDGKWGPQTETALKRLQADNDIAQSGKVDKQTKSLLFTGNNF